MFTLLAGSTATAKAWLYSPMTAGCNIKSPIQNTNLKKGNFGIGVNVGGGAFTGLYAKYFVRNTMSINLQIIVLVFTAQRQLCFVLADEQSHYIS